MSEWRKDIILYEMPSWAEYVPFSWMQDLVAWYIAKTVNRKMRRYEKRIALHEKMKGLK